MTLQRKGRSAEPASVESKKETSAPVAEVSSVAVVTPTLDALEETPEWEPHAAARPAPEEVIPDESFDVAQPAVAEEAPPEDVWADPTPTAMSDAVGLDEDATETPEEESASFSSLVEDEPFATAATATPAAADDPFAADDEPTTTPEAEAPAPEEASPVPTGGDLPEEEPFERAGRWWFKRGSELLVYNEQSGEWVPSPTPLPGLEEPEPSRYGPDSSVTQTITDLTALSPEGDADSAGAEEEREPSLIESTGQQGFWRCPACGAVNGSTSATCRMCFAARPAS